MKLLPDIKKYVKTTFNLGILPVTLPKTNIAPWKYAEPQEIRIQTIDFQGWKCQVLGGVVLL